MASISPDLSTLEEPRVAERVGGDQEDVEVCERDAEQGDPGQQHVPAVEPGDDAPGPVADGVLGEVLEAAAHDVPAGVAGGGVQPQEGGVGDQYQRADAHVAPLAGRVAEAEDRVPG